MMTGVSESVPVYDGIPVFGNPQGSFFPDWHRFKSFYCNTWLKSDKCIKLRTFLSRIY